MHRVDETCGVQAPICSFRVSPRNQWLERELMLQVCWLSCSRSWVLYIVNAARWVGLKWIGWPLSIRGETEISQPPHQWAHTLTDSCSISPDEACNKRRRKEGILILPNQVYKLDMAKSSYARSWTRIRAVHAVRERTWRAASSLVPGERRLRQLVN